MGHDNCNAKTSTDDGCEKYTGILRDLRISYFVPCVSQVWMVNGTQLRNGLELPRPSGILEIRFMFY